jgi:DNA-binding transcriptional LysR family regulator
MELEPMIVNPLCGMVKNPAVEGLVLRSGLESRNTTALLAFVHAGLGATILPESAMRATGGALSFLQPDDPGAFRHLLKIRQTTRPAPPVVETFWQSLHALSPGD